MNEWGKIDGIVHSVGFAPADQISGSIEESITGKVWNYMIAPTALLA